MFEKMDIEAAAKKARERAEREAERLWPPGWKYIEQRRRTTDDLAIKYFREYTGATP